MKIDLHVHSSHSKRPSDWILKKLGVHESYTRPSDVYRIAMNRGMDAVTITDHNTIDGCLEISNFPNTFISCEYTTYFQKDNCKIHVLCWDITVKQHEEIQEVRQNIYDLVGYLRQNKIRHGLAHPLYSINDRLTIDYFDKLLELFDVFELNGAKDSWANEYLHLILQTACNEDYALTAGSDDHSGLTIAEMYTYAEANTLTEFFESLDNKQTFPIGVGSSPHTLARNIYSVSLQHLIHRGKADAVPDVLRRYLLPEEYKTTQTLIQRLTSVPLRPKSWGRKIALSWLKNEFSKVDRWSCRHLPISEQWSSVLEQITNRHFLKFGNKLVDDLTQVQVMDLFSGIGTALFLYAILAPYFAAYSLFGKQRKFSRHILEKYRPGGASPLKIAKFTDNFGKIDGVSRTLEEQVGEFKRTGKDYTIITCVGEDKSHLPGVKYFKPIGVISAPEYSEQPLVWPPLLKILDYCYEEQFTHVQAATPGPMGLLAMLAAKTLGIGYHATYHTEIPQFIGAVTNTGFLEELAWKYIVWFYDNADTVFVPSEHTKKNLIDHGIKEKKIQVYPRGINIDSFHPMFSDRSFWKKYGIEGDEFIYLYVGRVSKEKNLPYLIAEYRQLSNVSYTLPKKHCLVVVGDGDYLEEMKAHTSDLSVVFTGYLEGKELSTAFASADVFVFPSVADTHGRVVLESLASGLPCIVSDVGGPQENVISWETGIIIQPEKDHLAGALEDIQRNGRLVEMKQNARRYAETKSFQKAFQDYWDMYK